MTTDILDSIFPFIAISWKMGPMQSFSMGVPVNFVWLQILLQTNKHKNILSSEIYGNLA